MNIQDQDAKSYPDLSGETAAMEDPKPKRGRPKKTATNEPTAFETAVPWSMVWTETKDGNPVKRIIQDGREYDSATKKPVK